MLTKASSSKLHYNASTTRILDKSICPIRGHISDRSRLFCSFDELNEPGEQASIHSPEFKSISGKHPVVFMLKRTSCTLRTSLSILHVSQLPLEDAPLRE